MTIVTIPANPTPDNLLRNEWIENGCIKLSVEHDGFLYQFPVDMDLLEDAGLLTDEDWESEDFVPAEEMLEVFRENPAEYEKPSWVITQIITRKPSIHQQNPYA